MTATATRSRSDPARDRPAPELFMLPIETIEAIGNIRTSLGNVDLEELAASIREHGVLSPIRVEQAGGRDGTARYALVYGQRRLLAAQLAGLTHIPALVDVDNRTGANLMVEQLVENLQRSDLNPLEEAAAYRVLLDTGLSQRDLARRLGRSQPSIADKLRILKLPEPVRDQVASGALSASHAKAIAALPADEITEMGRRIVEHKLSAHDVEAEVRLAMDRASAGDRRRDEARGLADAAEESLGKKRGLYKAKARLHVYDGDIAAELERRGWTMAKQTYGYTKPKGCDCQAWTISRNYMGTNATSKVTMTATCVVKAHYDAEQKAAAAAREKRDQEYTAAQTAKAAERAKGLDELAGTIAGDELLRSRLMLHRCVFDAYYDTDVDAFWEAILPPEVEHTRALDMWELIAPLSAEVVDHWLARMLAGDVVDEGLSLHPPAVDAP